MSLQGTMPWLTSHWCFIALNDLVIFEIQMFIV